MCFSAEASFISGAALSSGGVVALNLARRPAAKPYAAIPLLFGIHQTIEGVQWLAQTGRAPPWAGTAAVYAFLTIAFAWPFYMPLSLMLLERVSPPRRRIMQGLSFAGGVFSALAIAFVYLNGASAEASTHGHITYVYDVPQWGGAMRWIYVALTAIPAFLSSARFSRWFGAGILLTYAGAWYAAANSFDSVWCYFGALLSLLVMIVLRLNPVRAFTAPA